MNKSYLSELNVFVFVIALVAALGGFTLGFDAGVIVDGKDQITSEFHLSDFQWSIITCTSILGSIFAIPIVGRFVDKFGAKNILSFAAIGFILGLSLTASAYTLPQLITGRFIIGICIGIASFSSPLFISEISSPSIRGGMILLNGIAITAGQTISFLIGYFLHNLSDSSWRFILGIEIIPAILLLVGMIAMPQSPRWVAKKYGIEKSRIVLTRIRSKNTTTLEKELSEIQANISSTVLKTHFRELFSRKIMPVLMVGAGLACLQQFVGISAIMSYGPVVFHAVGFNSISAGIFATFCIGLVNLFFTIISAFLIDYIGRRFLLLSGTFIAAISMLLVGSVCLGSINEKWGIFFIVTYIIGYCISLGSLFWVLISEIFPYYIRGTAMSFVTAIQCAANLIISITFLAFFDFLGPANTFFIYGLMSAIAFVFIYYFIPETKGISLELIEENLNSGKKLRELGDAPTV